MVHGGLGEGSGRCSEQPRARGAARGARLEGTLLLLEAVLHLLVVARPPVDAADDARACSPATTPPLTLRHGWPRADRARTHGRGRFAHRCRRQSPAPRRQGLRERSRLQKRLLRALMKAAESAAVTTTSAAAARRGEPAKAAGTATVEGWQDGGAIRQRRPCGALPASRSGAHLCPLPSWPRRGRAEQRRGGVASYVSAQSPRPNTGNTCRRRLPGCGLDLT